MIDRTMAASPGLSVMPATNIRSIFRACTGNRWSWARLAKPVPKSSRAVWHPRARRRSSPCRARGGSSAIDVSVTSSHSAWGGRPVASSTADTSSISFGSASSLAETFTASSRAGRRSVRHAATCAQAISSTLPADAGHERRALGARDELRGGQEAELGVLPAHQRLDLHHDAVLGPDHRLVVDDELVVVDGGGEVDHQRAAVGRLGEHAVGHDDDAEGAVAPVAHEPGGEAHVDVRAVLRGRGLHARPALPLGEAPGDLVHLGLVLLATHHLLGGATDRLLGGPAEQLRGVVVPGHDAAVEVDHDDGFGPGPGELHAEPGDLGERRVDRAQVHLVRHPRPQTTGCDHTSTSTRVPGKVTIRIVSGSGQPPATWIARRLADTTAASGVRKSSIARPTRSASVAAPRSLTHALEAATISPSTWTTRGSAVVSSSCRYRSSTSVRRLATGSGMDSSPRW